MKKAIVLLSLGISLMAAPGVLSWIHVEEGDSGTSMRNINPVEVDLNIQGTHLWDYSSSNVTWDEIEENSWVKKTSEGLFGYLYTRPEAVSQTFSAIDTVESYAKIKVDGLLSYGFTTLRDGRASPSKIEGTDSAQVMVFPATLGDEWVSSYTMSGGEATLEVDDFNKVVDSGTVITDLDTFHCVVVRLLKQIDVKVFGITVQEINLYRYDWYVDSLTAVLTIQSGEEETDPLFSQAERVSRVTELSYFVPDTSDTNDAVSEKTMSVEEKLDAVFTINGLRLVLDGKNAGDVKLILYDASGRLVAERTWAGLHAGRNELFWNVDAGKGVYFLNLCRRGIRIKTKLIKSR